MYSASDLRKGLKVEIEGKPYIITEFNFVKPGKGAAIYNCKMKNLIDGTTLTKSYRSNDKIDEPNLEERTMRYSYKDGDNFVFIDANYEQINVPSSVLGDQQYFLSEDLECRILIHNGTPVAVELPTFVEKEIVWTEPGVRGDTATNVMKPAKIEGGFQVQVPLFVNQGDVIKIDTRTSTYCDRVKVAKG